ncbi:site-specific integrase [soil metagenome]
MSAQRGSVSRRKTKTGNIRWDARYRPDPKSRHITKTFDRKIDAETWLKARLHELETGTHVDRSQAATTFSEFAEQWLDTRIDVSERTLNHNRSMLAHAVEAFGDYPISEISRQRVQALLNAKTSTHSSNTVTHIRRVVRQVLDFAVESRAIPRNVAAGKSVSVPKIERSEPVVVSLDEIVRIADAAPDQYRAMILLTATTGLRYSEVAGLRVRSFDRVARTITVTNQLDRDTGELVPPKTKASRRTIKLSESIVFVLARHLTEHVEADDLDAWLFTSPGGDRLHYGNFMKRVWKPLVSDCGHPDLGFHDLRHSHAAHLIEAGEHAKTIQSRLGHSSIKTTLDVYGHLMEGMDESAAAKLDDALRGII